MKFKTTLLIALTAALLGCSSTEKVSQQAAPTEEAVAASVEPGAVSGHDAEAGRGTGLNRGTGSNGGGETSSLAGKTQPSKRPVLIGKIETKPMNLTNDRDRLFQNGPTPAEIKRFRARQKKRSQGSRLSADRGGHTMPMFADQLETVSEKG